MVSGKISLYAIDGACLRTIDYKYPKARRDAIASWEKEYGKNFQKCYIQIRPDTNEFKVNPKGVNTLKVPSKTKPEGYAGTTMKTPKVKINLVE